MLRLLVVRHCYANNTVDIICNDIYPAELNIVVTNASNLSMTFLDLDINILNNCFYTKLFDKRRDFSFKVDTFPNLCSNVTVKPSYGVFVGELYRICKSSSVVTEFIHDVKLLISKLITQNFKRKVNHGNHLSIINQHVSSDTGLISQFATSCRSVESSVFQDSYICTF